MGRGQEEKTTEVTAVTVPIGQGSAVPPTAFTTRARWGAPLPPTQAECIFQFLIYMRAVPTKPVLGSFSEVSHSGLAYIQLFRITQVGRQLNTRSLQKTPTSLQNPRKSRDSKTSVSPNDNTGGWSLIPTHPSQTSPGTGRVDQITQFRGKQFLK